MTKETNTSQKMSASMVWTQMSPCIFCAM